jgi:hypothetical protein
MGRSRPFQACQQAPRYALAAPQLRGCQLLRGQLTLNDIELAERSPASMPDDLGDPLMLDQTHPALTADDPSARSWSIDSLTMCKLVGLVAVLGVVVLPSWPGRINNDTIAMIDEIDRGRITDWHAPLLQVIWQPFFAIGVGVGAVFVGQVVVFYGALVVIVERVVGRRALAVAASVAICLFPTTYALLITATRDVWFICFWLCALAVLCRDRLSPRIRYALVTLFLLLCYAARQNGLAIAPVLFFAALGSEPRLTGSLLRRSARVVVATVMTGCLVLVMSVLLAVSGVRSTSAASVTPIFDLARLSVRSGTMKVPPEANSDGLTVADVASLSTPYVEDRLYTGGRGIDIQLNEAQRSAVMVAWQNEILSDPAEYLRMRWQLFTRQIGWSGNTRLAYVPDYIDNPFGITPAFPHLSSRATAYVQTFNAGPEWPDSGVMYRAWPVLALMAIASALAAARRRGSAIVVVAGVSSAFYAISIFFLAPELHSRMIAPSTIIGLICVTGLFVPWRDDADLTADFLVDLDADIVHADVAA